METRLFSLSLKYFKEQIEPLIAKEDKKIGRPPKIEHYKFFCAVIYVMRTGISWRDLLSCFGYWHTIYMRFKRWSENGLFWSLLRTLQQKKALKFDFTWIDSTTINIHRHGSGCLKKEEFNLLVEDVKM